MKSQFFKSILCVLMVLAMVVSLASCGQPSYKNGQYLNADGEVMEEEEVTLDVISMIHYQKKYDELTVSEERRRVVSLYLEHHLPASNETQLDGKNKVIDLVSGFDPDLPSVYENRLDLARGILSEASAALSLADIYAKCKDDVGFEEFVGKISKTCQLVDVAMQFSKACYIVSDLVYNDVDNKQEYCNDIIDGLTLITSNIPIFDEYFTQSLEIVKVGLQEVLEKYEMQEKMYSIYIKEIDPNAQTIFSANDTYAAMANSQLWAIGPNISDILQRKNLLSMIPAGKPYECFRDYILWRVPFELNGGKTESSNGGNQSTPSNSSATSSASNSETVSQPTIVPSNRPLCSDHNWKSTKIIKQATCQEKGIEAITCADCWATSQRELKKTDHNFAEKVIPPTTKKMGYSVFTCKVCGYYYMDKITDQLPPPPPSITEPTVWYGDGKQEHSKGRSFQLRVDSVSKDHISGYLEVSTVVLGKTKYTHQTNFSGTGQQTEEGYVYLLQFDQSVTFGVIPAYEYSELNIYYNSEKDTFSFKGMYEVTMKRSK